MEFGKQYIKTFEDIAAYTSFVNSSGFIRPNVSYCVSENKVFYTPKVSPVNAAIGDYLYSDFTIGTSTSDRTVIGVCVIPTGKLPDGKARFMSIKCMNCSTPESGSTNLDDSYIYWGGYNYDVDTIKNYNKVVIKVSGTSTLGMNAWGYLKLNSSYASNSNNIPSPFTEFDSYKDISVTEFNALSDFDGIGNTAKILAVDDVTGTSWRTESTVSNEDYNQYCHPAARCCYMYHTAGTSKGDWYLPAIGELGFLAENRDLISTKLVTAGGPDIASIQPYLWSSSEYDSDDARYLGLDDGGVYDTGKHDDGTRVFAFLAF